MKDRRIHIYTRERGKQPDSEHKEFKSEEYGNSVDEIISNLLPEITEYLIYEFEGSDDD